MAIPARAELRAELHCVSHNGLAVLTAQHWSDTAAGPARSWLRLVSNGRVAQDCRFTGDHEHIELEQFWAERSALFAPTALTEDQMWVRLAGLTRIEQDRCQRKDCSGLLAVARWFCPICHCDIRRVARGSMSGAHRRGDIQMRPAQAPDPTS
jgi:hypothetical protein